MTATNLHGIELRGVHKRFGTFTALRDLSLTVRRGELLALLGPNGAGKTTAISLMLGLRPPSSGTVRVFGDDPRHGATKVRLGAMLQESDLPGTLRVSELVELFASFYPRPLSTRDVLNVADLAAQAGKLGSTLSGGQKRRLMFALAIVGNPDLVFLDEPTTAMDTQSRAAFWAAIEHMKASGKTIVLTTHYLEEAERAADRVAVIDKGQLVASGTPSEVKASVDAAKVRLRSDLVLAELRALPFVTRAECDDRGLATLHTRAPEALLAHIVRAGVAFKDLEVTRASLEDAFLSLTAQA
ncbi:ABC transporter ATP-binding protein [Deinococcus yavapaiensis]|uniref:ABC-2 type transport system ATP-binding protein n=1 Tax=Deinococcus yavapaiensis KR-236 TaxID=694435 RepID=A0A318S1I0_9DEIO|nr:ABC transporter ATP-binding protein [Deinococcus yavapaiensis]PYE51086.1 ABC-2 type transport system ATP-binding protein [Deinococcus yavapaiensis KR-236]